LLLGEKEWNVYFLKSNAKKFLDSPLDFFDKLYLERDSDNNQPKRFTTPHRPRQIT
jgi:hypothetical protein